MAECPLWLYFAMVEMFVSDKEVLSIEYRTVFMPEVTVRGDVFKAFGEGK